MGMNYSNQGSMNYDKGVVGNIALFIKATFNGYITALLHPLSSFEVDRDTGRVVNLMPYEEFERVRHQSEIDYLTTNLMGVYDKTIGDPLHREAFETRLKTTLDDLL